MAKSPNMHYFYNVEYFEPLKGASSLEDVIQSEADETEGSSAISFEAQNNKVFTHSYDSSNPWLTTLAEQLQGVEGFMEFALYTSYPGLLIGTGNAHDISAKEAITGGFEFDWASGIPMIPGASLKGLLRSYFPDPMRKRPREMEKELAVLIRELTGKADLDPDALREEIFDFGDTFIGGFPEIQANDRSILAPDAITPHTKGATENPVPLSVLKVKPKVKYRFLFLLKDGELLSAEEKLDLFRELLQITGAGGKTNVGFGQLVTEEKNKLVKERPESYRMKLMREERPASQSGQNRGGQGGQNRGGKSGQNRGGQGCQNRGGQGRPATGYEIGHPYHGTVTGYNEKKSSAFVRLEDGSRASIFFKNVKGAKFGEIDLALPLGDVDAVYLGKDDRDFDKWGVKR